ncbi:hypothetical protein J0H58_16575 [bacterium]|nr:hypothetical protein [bacterium]
MVSHDRELLDAMDETVELTTLGATRYGGTGPERVTVAPAKTEVQNEPHTIPPSPYQFTVICRECLKCPKHCECGKRARLPGCARPRPPAK